MIMKSFYKYFWNIWQWKFHWRLKKADKVTISVYPVWVQERLQRLYKKNQGKSKYTILINWSLYLGQWCNFYRAN